MIVVEIVNVVVIVIGRVIVEIVNVVESER